MARRSRRRRARSRRSRAIDISQARRLRQRRASTRAEQDLPALGYVVSYRALQAALDAALRATRASRCAHGARVAALRGTPRRAERRDRATASRSHARLAVAADGAGASVEGIARERRDYGQVAVVAKVWRERRTTASRTSASRPTVPWRCCPRATTTASCGRMTPDDAARTLALDDAAFLAALARHCGRARCAAFTRVAERRSFPLVLEYARRPWSPRTWLRSATRRSRCIRSPGRASTSACAMRASSRSRCIARPRDALGEPRDACALRCAPRAATGVAASRSPTASCTCSAARRSALAARPRPRAARRACRREARVHARDALRLALADAAAPRLSERGLAAVSSYRGMRAAPASRFAGCRPQSFLVRAPSAGARANEETLHECEPNG